MSRWETSMVRIYVPNSGRHPYIRYLDHPRDSDLAGETNDSTPKYYTWQRFGGRHKMTRLPIQYYTWQSFGGENVSIWREVWYPSRRRRAAGSEGRRQRWHLDSSATKRAGDAWSWQPNIPHIHIVEQCYCKGWDFIGNLTKQKNNWTLFVVLRSSFIDKLSWFQDFSLFVSPPSLGMLPRSLPLPCRGRRRRLPLPSIPLQREQDCRSHLRPHLQ